MFDHHLPPKIGLIVRLFLFIFILMFGLSAWTTQAAPSGQEVNPKPVSVLSGHSRGVTGLAFSPDGTQLVSGSYDVTLRLWNVPGGDLRLIHAIVPATVSSVAFSPDGNWIAYGVYDNSVHLWNPTTDEDVALAGHTGPVALVAFSPDGKTLASAGQDSTIRLWDVTSHAQTTVLDASHVTSGVGWGALAFILAVRLRFTIVSPMRVRLATSLPPCKQWIWLNTSSARGGHATRSS